MILHGLFFGVRICSGDPSLISIIFVVRPLLKLKNFQDFPSHQILLHLHIALNIDKNKN
jgi:hypothetical protein